VSWVMLLSDTTDASFPALVVTVTACNCNAVMKRRIIDVILRFIIAK